MTGMTLRQRKQWRVVKEREKLRHARRINADEAFNLKEIRDRVVKWIEEWKGK